MKATILAVEDDQDLSSFLEEALTLEGYRVIRATDAAEAMRVLGQQHVDLILLDILMPRLNGWELCRRIRQSSTIPVIIMTALAREQEVIHGLDLGADDYVTKPFRVGELKARIRALLRRSDRDPREEDLIQIDDRLAIDRAQCRAVLGGQPVKLSSIEYKLLTCFIDHAGCILSHRSLLSHVWGWEYADETNYVKVYVNRLRGKIEEDPADPKYILTERGLGYRFQMPSRSDCVKLS